MSRHAIKSNHKFETEINNVKSIEVKSMTFLDHVHNITWENNTFIFNFTHPIENTEKRITKYLVPGFYTLGQIESHMNRIILDSLLSGIFFKGERVEGRIAKKDEILNMPCFPFQFLFTKKGDRLCLEYKTIDQYTDECDEFSIMIYKLVSGNLRRAELHKIMKKNFHLRLDMDTSLFKYLGLQVFKKIGPGHYTETISSKTFDLRPEWLQENPYIQVHSDITSDENTFLFLLPFDNTITCQKVNEKIANVKHKFNSIDFLVTDSEGNKLDLDILYEIKISKT